MLENDYYLLIFVFYEIKGINCIKNDKILILKWNLSFFLSIYNLHSFINPPFSLFSKAFMDINEIRNKYRSILEEDPINQANKNNQNKNDDNEEELS